VGGVVVFGEEALAGRRGWMVRHAGLLLLGVEA